MAINIEIVPQLFSPVGLAEVNPITLVAKKTGSENVADLAIKDANNNVVTTLRSVFNSQNAAYFDVSEILKSLFRNYEVQDTSQNLVVAGYILDTEFRFVSYKLQIGEEIFEGFAVWAGLDSYNLYFQNTLETLQNLQSDFWDYVITADDLFEPFRFLVDFEETDYNFEDFN